MKLKELLLVVHLLVGFHFILHAQNHLVVYPAPDEVDLKKDFTVKVREVGKEWQGASVVVWYHSEDQRQYDDFYTRPSA